MPASWNQITAWLEQLDGLAAQPDGAIAPSFWVGTTQPCSTLIAVLQKNREIVRFLHSHEDGTRVDNAPDLANRFR